MNAKAQKEAQMLLTIDTYKRGYFRSIWKAADAYSVEFSSLDYRLHGRASRVDSRPNY